MPFDEEEYVEDLSPKVALKKVSTQKSIFESLPKKPTQKNLDEKVKASNERSNNYKIQAAELVKQFNKSMADKTLPQNKNLFAQELEKELLANMIVLADEINNDEDEGEGLGSLSWITILLKNSFSQRDRINKLEFNLTQMEKKLNSQILSENSQAIDKKKNSE